MIIAASFFMISLTHLYTYFLMTGVLTLFTMYIEKNIFMEGLERDEAGIVSPLCDNFSVGGSF